MLLENTVGTCMSHFHFHGSKDNNQSFFKSVLDTHSLASKTSENVCNNYVLSMPGIKRVKTELIIIRVK